MSDDTTTVTGTSGPTEASVKTHSLWHRLFHGETTYDFVGKRNIGFILSGLLLLVSVLGLFTRGLNLGIEFDGGVQFEFPAKSLSTGQAEDLMAGFGLGAAKVQTLNSPSSDGNRLRIQTEDLSQDRQTEIVSKLASEAGIDVSEVSVNSVGPSWGKQITNKAIRALVVFFILIAIYISLRFEWRMAIAALLAVLHDVLISVGVYAVTGFEVTPATVIAFLTILGYSLYDTIVVFDRLRDNTRRLTGSGKYTYSDIVNLSMNQTLMRSINTSLAAVLPVLSLLIVGSLIMGAVALQDFALALLVGLITGAYSSIFIATPVLAIMKEREPRYRQLRERLAGRHVDILAMRQAASGDAGVGGRTRTPVTAAAGSAPSPSGGPITTGPRPVSGTAIPPRPRKKKKR